MPLVDLDRPVDQFDRIQVSSELVGDDPEKMQCVGMVRLNLEQSSISLLHLADVPHRVCETTYYTCP